MNTTSGLYYNFVASLPLLVIGCCHVETFGTSQAQENLKQQLYEVKEHFIKQYALENKLLYKQIRKLLLRTTYLFSL